MKIVRSSKCSLKFATIHKRQELKRVLTEYGRVCNIFIVHFWNNRTPAKKDLLKNIVDIPETWLSARLRKVAAREAIDMIRSVKERWKDHPEKTTVPVHRGKRMYVSSNIAELQDKETAEFDAWLHLASVGEKTILDLPVKFHRHFNKLALQGKRLNSYIVTKSCVQFAFEIDTGPKRKGTKALGIDTGINALASLSNGTQLGLDIKACVERIKGCEQGSNGQKKARRAMRQGMDEVVKELLVIYKHIDLIVVERLKNLNFKSKLKRRLSRNIRRSIGTWAYRYWLKRLEQACETNRVSFRTVPPFNTSRTCPSCGHVDRGNRVLEVFQCLKCGLSGNADLVAAGNILTRFLMGPYGTRYQPG